MNYPILEEAQFSWLDETLYRVRRASRGLAVDDDRRSFALVASPLYRPATGVLHHCGMLCVCLRISCRYALSQTRRKTRVRRGSLLFDSPGRTHLPGTSRHSFLRIYSRQLLLI